MKWYTIILAPLVLNLGVISCKKRTDHLNGKGSAEQSSPSAAINFFENDESILVIPQGMVSANTNKDLSDEDWAFLLSLSLEDKVAASLQSYYKAEAASLALVTPPSGAAAKGPASPRRPMTTSTEPDSDLEPAPSRSARSATAKSAEEVDAAAAPEDAPKALPPRAERSAYFESKWPDLLDAKGGHPKFNEMPAVITRVGRAPTTPSASGRVWLGILPDDKVLSEIKSEIAGKGAGKALSVMSVVETFEVKHLGRPRAAPAEPTALGDVTRVAREDGANDDAPAFKVRLRPDELPGSAEEVRVRVWTQVATPDRSIMPRQLLALAIDDLATQMDDGQNVYVHCKSGHGRSVVVVAGARMAIAMRDLEAAGETISGPMIDELLSEQFAQIMAARPVAGAWKQRENLRRIIYARARLPEPATTMGWKKPAGVDLQD